MRRIYGVNKILFRGFLFLIIVLHWKEENNEGGVTRIYKTRLFQREYKIQRVRYTDAKQEKRSSPPENLLGSCPSLLEDLPSRREKSQGRGGGEGL